MRVFLVAGLAVVLAGCANKQKMADWSTVHGEADQSTTRTIEQGTLTGFKEAQGNFAWLGIPYATPPIGELRWKAPRAPTPFASDYQAVKYGSACPQLKGQLSGADNDGAVTGSEDCLTLNVFAPSMSAEESATRRLPVMFWIHGGGNTIGTANTYGAVRNLANTYGVVVVTVNYRLGVLGWFHHPSLLKAESTPEDASGNYGTLDLIAALKWVNANVAAFGGDPKNVTVFGESAGGFDTFALLASPMARGLFHRAAVQSGIPGGQSLTEAWHFTDDAEPGVGGSSGEVLLMQLISDGKAKDRAGAKQVLAAMTPAEVQTYLVSRTAEQLIAPFKTSGFGMYRSPALLRDGAVLPAEPMWSALAHANPEVPVLLGTNRDEYKLFLLLNPKYVTRFIGFHIRDDVAYERDAAAVSQTWRAIGVDTPVDQLKKAGVKTFSYRFDWDEEPKFIVADLPKLLGAAHGLEMGFVFNDQAGELDFFDIGSEANAPGRKLLAKQMSSYWAQFAKTGDPGRGFDGSLPEWKDTGDLHTHVVFDTEAGGGIRLENGAVVLDQLDEKLMTDTSFASQSERCDAYRQLFKGFAGSAGGWTDARAARFARECPDAK